MSGLFSTGPTPKRGFQVHCKISKKIFRRVWSMAMIEYKGYLAKIDVDEDARLFHGEVVNLRDVITFEADCMDDLLQAFHDSIDDYLEFCDERGEDPEKSFS